MTGFEIAGPVVMTETPPFLAKAFIKLDDAFCNNSVLFITEIDCGECFNLVAYETPVTVTDSCSTAVECSTKSLFIFPVMAICCRKEAYPR